MSEYRFSLTSNAGVSICFDSAVIWMDALHTQKASSYSTLSVKDWDAIKRSPYYIGNNLKGPDAICFSHCHIDHFTSEIVREAMELWPDAPVILPENYFPGQRLISGDSMEVTVSGISLHYIRTAHSTKRHHHKRHYSVILSDGSVNIFMPMDSSLSDPAMLYYAAETDVDLAIVDYSWLLFQKGTDIILNEISPAHLLVYHLPFEEDDLHSHRPLVKEAAARLIKDYGLDVRILGGHLQTECVTM